MQEVFNIILLSITQGILEFLPVSSSAHLKLLNSLLHAKHFKEVKFFLELATFLCVLFYYRSIILGYTFGLFQKSKSAVNFFLKLGISCIPFAIAFSFLSKSGLEISFFLILGSIFFVISELIYKKRGSTISDIENVSFLQALGVGCFQILSMFSGFSRSGSCIAGGLILGLERRLAVRFAFLISLPLTFASLVYDYLKLSPSFSLLNLFGFFSCLFIATIAIKPCFKVLSNISLMWFAGYRILLALVLIVAL